MASEPSSSSPAYVYDPHPPKLPLYKYVVAGGGAGISEILVMYPLDVAKTRLQLQVSTKGSEIAYRGIWHCLTSIVQSEGPLALYRGIVSPILAEAPKRAWKFAANEEFKGLFKPYLAAAIVPAAAGASAGLTEALVNTPFEVVKVRVQAKNSVYKSTGEAAMKIMKGEGLAGLYRGGSAQALRNALWCAVYFAVIAELKSAFPIPESKTDELLRNMAAGTIGGSFATLFNTPIDVVKSRMQNTPVGQPLPGIATTLVQIFKNEGGIAALYKGLLARLLRLGPGGGIMLVGFNVISEWLS